MAIEIAKRGNPTVAAKPLALPRFGASRVGAGDRAFFLERLALLLEARVPLHTALHTLETQVENPALARLLADARADVVEGKPFSQALGRHPEVFSAAYVNLIAASEGGGFLHEVLKQLIDMEEKAARLRNVVVAALSYPAILLVFSFAVVVFVLVGVFPRFEEIFSQIRDRLPVTTLALMAASDLVRGYWPALLAGTALAAYGAALALRRPELKAAVDRWVLRLPVLKTLVTEYYLVRTLRVLGVSLTHGVPLVSALAASREVTANREFQAFVRALETSVTEGRGLSAGFAGSAFIPPLARQMISTGEETATLPLVMARLSDFYQKALERRIEMLARLAEPLMLALMGGLVGVIVSALILPIFKLAGAVQ